MNAQDELKATVRAMVQSGNGILAADESAPTIAKRFKPEDSTFKSPFPVTIGSSGPAVLARMAVLVVDHDR